MFATRLQISHSLRLRPSVLCYVNTGEIIHENGKSENKYVYR